MTLLELRLARHRQSVPPPQQQRSTRSASGSVRTGQGGRRSGRSAPDAAVTPGARSTARITRAAAAAATAAAGAPSGETADAAARDAPPAAVPAAAFTLGASEPQLPVVKRGPGRPRKLPLPAPTPAHTAAPAGGLQGHPQAPTAVEAATAAAAASAAPAAAGAPLPPVVKRGPGRPRKLPLPAAAPEPAGGAYGLPQAKAATNAAAVAAAAAAPAAPAAKSALPPPVEKRGPGRPRKLPLPTTGPGPAPAGAVQGVSNYIAAIDVAAAAAAAAAPAAPEAKSALPPPVEKRGPGQPRKLPLPAAGPGPAPAGEVPGPLQAPPAVDTLATAAAATIAAPAAESAPPPPVEKRGPGRPRKLPLSAPVPAAGVQGLAQAPAAEEAAAATAAATTAAPAAESAPPPPIGKRGPGRPRKLPLPAPAPAAGVQGIAHVPAAAAAATAAARSAAPVADSAPPRPVEKRGPGRPRKLPLTAPAPAGIEQGAAPAGPAASLSRAAIAAAAAAAAAAAPPTAVAVPALAAGGSGAFRPITAALHPAPLKRPRGRPPKARDAPPAAVAVVSEGLDSAGPGSATKGPSGAVTAAAAAAAAEADNAAAAAAPAKRRGRPPGASSGAVAAEREERGAGDALAQPPQPAPAKAAGPQGQVAAAAEGLQGGQVAGSQAVVEDSAGLKSGQPGSRARRREGGNVAEVAAAEAAASLAAGGQQDVAEAGGAVARWGKPPRRQQQQRQDRQAPASQTQAPVREQEEAVQKHERVAGEPQEEQQEEQQEEEQQEEQQERAGASKTRRKQQPAAAAQAASQPGRRGRKGAALDELAALPTTSAGEAAARPSHRRSQQSGRQPQPQLQPQPLPQAAPASGARAAGAAAARAAGDTGIAGTAGHVAAGGGAVGGSTGLMSAVARVLAAAVRVAPTLATARVEPGWSSGGGGSSSNDSDTSSSDGSDGAGGSDREEESDGEAPQPMDVDGAVGGGGGDGGSSDESSEESSEEGSEESSSDDGSDGDDGESADADGVSEGPDGLEGLEGGVGGSSDGDRMQGVDEEGPGPAADGGEDAKAGATFAAAGVNNGMPEPGAAADAAVTAAPAPAVDGNKLAQKRAQAAAAMRRMRAQQQQLAAAARTAAGAGALTHALPRASFMAAYYRQVLRSAPYLPPYRHGQWCAAELALMSLTRRTLPPLGRSASKIRAMDMLALRDRAALEAMDAAATAARLAFPLGLLLRGPRLTPVDGAHLREHARLARAARRLAGVILPGPGLGVGSRVVEFGAAPELGSGAGGAGTGRAAGGTADADVGGGAGGGGGDGGAAVGAGAGPGAAVGAGAGAGAGAVEREMLLPYIAVMAAAAGVAPPPSAALLLQLPQLPAGLQMPGSIPPAGSTAGVVVASAGASSAMAGSGAAGADCGLAVRVVGEGGVGGAVHVDGRWQAAVAPAAPLAGGRAVAAAASVASQLRRLLLAEREARGSGVAAAAAAGAYGGGGDGHSGRATAEALPEAAAVVSPEAAAVAAASALGVAPLRSALGAPAPMWAACLPAAALCPGLPLPAASTSAPVDTADGLLADSKLQPRMRPAAPGPLQEARAAAASAVVGLHDSVKAQRRTVEAAAAGAVPAPVEAAAALMPAAGPPLCVGRAPEAAAQAADLALLALAGPWWGGASGCDGRSSTGSGSSRDGSSDDGQALSASGSGTAASAVAGPLVPAAVAAVRLPAAPSPLNASGGLGEYAAHALELLLPAEGVDLSRRLLAIRHGVATCAAASAPAASLAAPVRPPAGMLRVRFGCGMCAACRDVADGRAGVGGAGGGGTQPCLRPITALGGGGSDKVHIGYLRRPLLASSAEKLFGRERAAAAAVTAALGWPPQLVYSAAAAAAESGGQALWGTAGPEPEGNRERRRQKRPRSERAEAEEALEAMGRAGDAALLRPLWRRRPSATRIWEGNANEAGDGQAQQEGERQGRETAMPGSTAGAAGGTSGSTGAVPEECDWDDVDEQYDSLDEMPLDVRRGRSRRIAARLRRRRLAAAELNGFPTNVDGAVTLAPPEAEFARRRLATVAPAAPDGLVLDGERRARNARWLTPYADKVMELRRAELLLSARTEAHRALLGAGAARPWVLRREAQPPGRSGLPLAGLIDVTNGPIAAAPAAGRRLPPAVVLAAAAAAGAAGLTHVALTAPLYPPRASDACAWCGALGHTNKLTCPLRTLCAPPLQLLAPAHSGPGRSAAPQQSPRRGGARPGDGAGVVPHAQAAAVEMVAAARSLPAPHVLLPVPPPPLRHPLPHNLPRAWHHYSTVLAAAGQLPCGGAADAAHDTTTVTNSSICGDLSGAAAVDDARARLAVALKDAAAAETQLLPPPPPPGGEGPALWEPEPDVVEVRDASEARRLAAARARRKGIKAAERAQRRLAAAATPEQRRQAVSAVHWAVAALEKAKVLQQQADAKLQRRTYVQRLRQLQRDEAAVLAAAAPRAWAAHHAAGDGRPGDRKRKSGIDEAAAPAGRAQAKKQKRREGPDDHAGAAPLAAGLGVGPEAAAAAARTAAAAVAAAAAATGDAVSASPPLPTWLPRVPRATLDLMAALDAAHPWATGFRPVLRLAGLDADGASAVAAAEAVAAAGAARLRKSAPPRSVMRNQHVKPAAAEADGAGAAGDAEVAAVGAVGAAVGTGAGVGGFAQHRANDGAGAAATAPRGVDQSNAGAAACAAAAADAAADTAGAADSAVDAARVAATTTVVTSHRDRALANAAVAAVEDAGRAAAAARAALAAAGLLPAQPRPGAPSHQDERGPGMGAAGSASWVLQPAPEPLGCEMLLALALLTEAATLAGVAGAGRGDLPSMHSGT
ncbi:hypothetical protein CHLRE_07g341000v5 [Chlamydomonas reinhardtii]|uniref:Uncharacterized protein n=1 Tax=Chlamydomonas reinhardtii TaxID=3055 RepID=A0A2K3DKN3_CHLRE|nr:uncharacterized protein CHLRE_07g341000v5 [Chlamydomonas reinhardtii]PNW81107.1 hypothetical protein CHLRE_07g341000v5 [Chlamydomonas reinhardtii]